MTTTFTHRSELGSGVQPPAAGSLSRPRLRLLGGSK
jgi:hypothetical protein